MVLNRILWYHKLNFINYYRWQIFLGNGAPVFGALTMSSANIVLNYVVMAYLLRRWFKIEIFPKNIPVQLVILGALLLLFINYIICVHHGRFEMMYKDINPLIDENNKYKKITLFYTTLTLILVLVITFLPN
jgi:hypothetical protein